MNMNLPSVIILVLVLICFALAVWYLLRHRGGCSGCSGNCAQCRNHCHNRK